MKKILLPLIVFVIGGAWRSCHSTAEHHDNTQQTEHRSANASHRHTTTTSTSSTAGSEEVDSEPPAEVSPDQFLEIPITPATTVGEQIVHRGYTTHYNTQWLIPNWVAYELTPEETQTSIKREGEFQSDPLVRGNTAIPADYKRSGYDRGHMAPAADMKFNRKSMYESFYLSNICPQNHELNTGLWSVLEKRIRKWAERGETIYVVCGPIVKNTDHTIGQSRVVVPQAFFKVLCKKVAGQTYTLGFVFPNENCQGNIYNYSMSVDAVEKRTGFDFFSLLPDDVETAAERSSDLRVWQ